MRNVIGFILTFIICAVQNVYAQKDTIYLLDEVVVKGYKLKKYSKGIQVKKISDTLISKNNASLTDVLRFNSSIYFKEYGNGMLSSASFRGTSASQTAVVWNGININSQLNGQTDFNTLGINNFNSIDVRSGGGSVLFGSGAVGGSVHLNNTILFKNKSKTVVDITKGSYNTTFFNANTTQANSKSFINFGLNYAGSDNDYPFLETDLKNENGEYSRFGFNGNFGVKLNQKNRLKLYSIATFNDRNLARSLNAPSKSKLKNNTFRNLLEWNSFINNQQVITTRFAYLTEEYQYFENRFSPENFSKNQAQTIIANVDYQRQINNKLHINTVVNYESVIGKGNNIANQKRNVIAFTSVLNHFISEKLSYSAQLRKEFSSVYKVPLLYSLSTEIKPFNNYTISINTSKNFRAPTINDLFWKGSGNRNLQPEESYQYELSNNISFKNIGFSVTGFYIKSSNLIQWSPNPNSGNWEPNNIAKAKNYGVESTLNIRKKVSNHQVSFATNYALTFAKDIEKDSQLIYVPKHKVNFLFDYKFKNLSIYYQQLVNGKVAVFTGELPAYTVANVGANYQLHQINLGFKINNIYNMAYQNYQYYPMPPRNYQLKFKINI